MLNRFSIDIGNAVLTNDVIGSWYCSYCGGTPLDFGVAVGTTGKNIVFLESLNEKIPGTHKFSAIYFFIIAVWLENNNLLEIYYVGQLFNR